MADGSGQDPREGARPDGTYHYKYSRDAGGENRQGSSQQEGAQQGGSHYEYQYKYSYGSGKGTTPAGGNKPPKGYTDWGEWVGIGFMLFILPFWACKLVGVLWLLSKLGKMTASDKRRYKQEARNAANRAKNTAQDFFRRADASAKAGAQEFFRQADVFGKEADTAQRQEAQGSSASGGRTYSYSYQQDQSKQEKQSQDSGETYRSDPWDMSDPSESRRKRLKKKLGGGKGLIIAGSILAGIFGLGTLACLTPVFLGEFEYPLLIPILACLMFATGGVSMLFSGLGKGRAAERYINYLAYIGANQEVDLAPMAANFGVSVGKLCKDLRRMLAKEILPMGYLDLSEGKLYLTEAGYRSPGVQRAAPPKEETPQQAAAREDDILREIRQVNDEIPDEVMSAKIDRIEEITGKILSYQKSHPNKEGQLRTFLNYYLPTTLKILRAYAQLDAQGIEGENISAAKKRIEDMMDQVVSGFEKQLDKLFQDDAMDITSDVEVLENMLKKDGLSDEGGITMTL